MRSSGWGFIIFKGVLEDWGFYIDFWGLGNFLEFIILDVGDCLWFKDFMLFGGLVFCCFILSFFFVFLSVYCRNISSFCVLLYRFLVTRYCFNNLSL